MLKNRLQNSRRVAEQMAAIARAVPRAQLGKLSDEQRQVVEQDYQQLLAELDRATAELAEREIELRIWRLLLARRVLEEQTLTPERVLAAYSWQMDAQHILDFFEQSRKNKTKGFIRAELNDPELPRWVEAEAARARQLAGDLTGKAQLLFTGLHWWLRGRYGAGPEVFGLAKSPAAMRSPAAQLALYMPATPPVPTDPAFLGDKEPPVPWYDRRHHYWWAWEDRRISRSGFDRGSGGSETTFTGRVDTVHAEFF